MKNIPWIVSSALVACLVGTVLFFSKQIEQRDAQIDELKMQMHDLAIEADRKLQAANQQTANVVNEANQKLSAANQQYTNAVDDANQKIQAANQPEVEARVSFRKALLSEGNVAIITNTSSESAEYVVDIERSGSQQKQFRFVLNARSTKEIGQREGWAFIPGDRLNVSQAGHKTMSYAQ